MDVRVGVSCFCGTLRLVEHEVGDHERVVLTTKSSQETSVLSTFARASTFVQSVANWGDRETFGN